MRTGNASLETNERAMVDINAVDILFEIEKRIGINLNPARVEPLLQKRSSCDVTMRELHDIICSYPPLCRKCRYDLRGHSGVGRCPECGTAFDLRDHADDGRWRALREVVSSALKIPVEHIEPESFLHRDLMKL